MNLETARKYAEHVVRWLGPHCARIEVAGSIRRERPECADIDIVCIPRLAAVTANRVSELFGTREEKVVTNEVWMVLTAYVHEHSGRGAAWVKGVRPEHSAEFLLVQLPKCQLDVFFAEDETWGTRLLCRTGSKEFNVEICRRAKDLGGHWNPAAGLELGGQVYSRCEREILERVGLGWINATERER